MKALVSMRQIIAANGERALYGSPAVGDTPEKIDASVPVVCWGWIDKPGRAQIVALVPEDRRPFLCRADDWSNFLRVES